MAINKYDFIDFLSDIRLQDKTEFKNAHATLRKRLNEDEDLKPILVSDFLQGSYRRYTAIKPADNGRPDVDIVVVTNLDKETVTPRQAMNRFVPFLNKHYPEKDENWGYNERSFWVLDGEVEMDLVVTAAPSEVTAKAVQSSLIRSDDTLEGVNLAAFAEFAKSLRYGSEEYGRVLLTQKDADPWRSEPLYIPNRKTPQGWTPSDPLAQIAWSSEKNTATNAHYVNVVKALKWWKRNQLPKPKYPKGYPLEHIVGQNCPNGIDSVAEGVVLTLEGIVTSFRWHRMVKQVPVLPDHGVPEHNVLGRLSADDFAGFYDGVKDAAQLARRAYGEDDPKESARLWHELFGDPFPLPDESEGEETTQTAAASVKTERFA